MALFINHTESLGCTKNPESSTPESQIGHHDSAEPTDDITLNIVPNTGSHETEPLDDSTTVRLYYFSL